jgi:stage II sporulation protein AA (anti-sigma F factor antagonist)
MNVTATGDSPPDRALFAVDTEYAGHCARTALHGELDLATVRLLDDELRLVWQHDVRRIELDLRGLTFIGSSGIAALLEINGRARRVGVTLTLVRGPAQVQRIFELTGIESQFVFREGSARPDERQTRGGPLGIVS